MNVALPADGSIPTFLDRRPFVGTFTNLDQLRSKCEYKFYRIYIKKDIPYIETEAMAWGKKVHSAFESRLSDARQPLPDNMRQWEGFATPFKNYKVVTELKMGMTDHARQTGFYEGDVWFRGISDAVVLQGDKAFILDLKTGKSNFEDPFELATNALLLKVKYPELKKVVASYAWLKENRMGQQYDVSNFKETFMEITRLMNLIVEKRKTEEWVKIKSGLCGWCPISECENWYEAKK